MTIGDVGLTRQRLLYGYWVSASSKSLAANVGAKSDRMRGAAAVADARFNRHQSVANGALLQCD